MSYCQRENNATTRRLTTSFHWLRRWIHVPDSETADDIDNLMAWACWAVPLLVAEPLIQLRSMRKRVRVSTG